MTLDSYEDTCFPTLIASILKGPPQKSLIRDLRPKFGRGGGMRRKCSL